jgi:hypothetical protein
MPGRGIFVRGEIACAVCAIALILTMSVLAWFGVDGIPTRDRPGVHTVDAWSAMPVLSVFLCGVAVLAIASPLLHLTQRRHGVRTESSLLVAVGGTAVLVALAWRLLVDLPEPSAIVDQKLGGLIGLGLLAGLVITAWSAVAAGRAERAARTAAPARRRRDAARTAAPAHRRRDAPPASTT